MLDLRGQRRPVLFFRGGDTIDIVRPEEIWSWSIYWKKRRHGKNSYLLKKYDVLFAPNLYSFRCETGVKKAVYQIRKRVDLKHAFCYKVDIHDYFNSVDTEQILSLLRMHLPEEEKLLSIFSEMLRNPYVYKENELVQMKKGIMAGVPTSGFLANLYLMELDYWFAEREIPYIRYSDDIIVFAGSAEQRMEYETVIKEVFQRKNLTVNPRKEVRKDPGESIDFLGFEFSGNKMMFQISR